MSLVEYNKKRNFRKTREPAGKKENSKESIFVIQEHHASHLHYDFRLELDGVLKSWAVPKGPPTKPKEKRLAVQVEDHPVSYATFEGEIPKGEYGAGQVKIWDHGYWKTSKNAREQLKKGHLDFELHGHKLQGTWSLIRTKLSGKKANWLLIKRSAEALKLPTQKLPDFIEPELCTLTETAPTGADWIHEVKFDGYRTLAHISGAKTKLLTRTGLDWSKKYQKLLPEFKKIPVEKALIDGEIVWLNDKGLSQFGGLQEALQEGHSEDLIFYAFDILHLNGKDLTGVPLIQRKELLEALLKKAKSSKILYSAHKQVAGEDFFKAACNLDLEGMISKKSNSIYEPGRGRDWLKTKCKHDEEFVIGGYTLQKESSRIGALLMGLYDSKTKKLRYIGKVGTGFNQKNSGLLLKKLKALESDDSPFSRRLPSRSIFVKPKLVAQIEFGAWTSEHVLRHAAFKGLREDKPAHKVTGEIKAEASLEKQTLQLTHPEKILFPKAKITKLQVAQYYLDIQEKILPHALERPLSLLRCPQGSSKTCFFQKHLTKDEEIIHIRSLEELLELIQINSLELHARNCHMEDLLRPDQIVFDLDPDPMVSWKAVKEAALTLKSYLDHLKLKSYLKVSGNKGLHIHVPIQTIYTWDEIKMFSKNLCQQMEENEPNKYTTNILKKKRKGRIFLDYLRNQEEATAVLPYSLRKNDSASIALPIFWKDLKNLKSPAQFTLKNTKTKDILKSNPWKDYFKSPQRIRILDRYKSP